MAIEFTQEQIEEFKKIDHLLTGGIELNETITSLKINKVNDNFSNSWGQLLSMDLVAYFTYLYENYNATFYNDLLLPKQETFKCLLTCLIKVQAYNALDSILLIGNLSSTTVKVQYLIALIQAQQEHIVRKFLDAYVVNKNPYAVDLHLIQDIELILSLIKIKPELETINLFTVSLFDYTHNDKNIIELMMEDEELKSNITLRKQVLLALSSKVSYKKSKFF